MKSLSRVINIVLYIFVALALTAAIGSAVAKKPVLMSSIRSNSMYPLFRRGDMILVKGVSDSTALEVGDIVVFKTEKGSLSTKGWIVHRIMDGNAKDGFITKGDANEHTDQAMDGAEPIKPDMIASRVVTLGRFPLKLPLLGYLPLWMEKFRDNPYLLPLIAVILAVVIGVSELMGDKKKKKRKDSFYIQLVYFFSGLTVSIVMAATMLAASQRLVIPYEVSKSSQGVIMGSNVGILRVGEVVEKPLSKLANKGFFPIMATVNSDDNQFSFNVDRLTLRPRENLEVMMTVNASKPGRYNSVIQIGMFYPFLPRDMIYSLASINYWLALAAVSLIPGLPIMLYPIIDGKLRRKTKKEFRRLTRRIQGLNPF